MDVKIPFYNLVNMLLIGMVFIIGWFTIDMWLISEIFGFIQFYEIPSSLALCILFPVSYQIGLIINRFGSLMEDILKTEVPLKNRGWISRHIQFTWRSYELYQKAEKIDPFIKTLSREYALSRNSLTLFLLLAVVAFTCCKIDVGITMVILSMLFYFSMRKHSGKIISRIDFCTKASRKQ
jgi:hypothetical protein